MSKIKTFKRLWIQDKHQVIVALYNNIVHTGVTNFLTDEDYLRITYRIRFGKKLDLDNPVTFNQKMQWLKLYDHQWKYTELVDKIKVKNYVAKKIGSKHLIPTLGVFDSFDRIDFEALPKQFVLKCNHDSGSIVICKDKSIFNMERARKKITKSLNTDAYNWGREWPYRNVQRKILAEAYMTDTSAVKGSDSLQDYKIYCFNGIPMVILVCRDRFSETDMTEDFFDTTWNHLNVRREGHGNSRMPISRPSELDQMLYFARELSKGNPFLRVDFYIIDHQIYFGELTFYPASGFEKFIPEKFDYEMGSWINLDGLRVK